mmetsp:Transcript_47157/g.135869  ORF Transcript_47157/g.135869 Transcript_47157/m.135869 type:complete len:214 (-) Transcript_47157:21-662(-)
MPSATHIRRQGNFRPIGTPISPACGSRASPPPSVRTKANVSSSCRSASGPKGQKNDLLSLEAASAADRVERKSSPVERRMASQLLRIESMKGRKTSRLMPEAYSSSGAKFDVATTVPPASKRCSKKVRMSRASPMFSTWHSSKQRRGDSSTNFFATSAMGSWMPPTVCRIRCSSRLMSSIKSWKWARRLRRPEDRTVSWNMFIIIVFPAPGSP